MLLAALLGGPMAYGKAPPPPEKVEAMKQRREGSLKPADPAPDVALVGLDGKPVQLLAAKKPDRPLVLIFGSFT